ncbi:MAG: RNA polymerase sigma factor [Microgenomates group bacterium]
MRKDIKKLTDEEIVEKIIKEDKQLFAEIIERYEKKILRYIYYLTGDSQENQDIAQNIFIKAYINLKSFNKSFKFSSWLFRIAHNEAVNFLKKKKYNLSFDEKILKIEDEKKIDEEVFKKQLKIMVKKCLEQLPILYKEVVDLFYFENLSYEEISDVLKIPPGTVAIRLSRAKSFLKKICQDQKI